MFVKGELLKRKLTDVSVVHSRVLYDIECYDAQIVANPELESDLRVPITKALQGVSSSVVYACTDLGTDIRRPAGGPTESQEVAGVGACADTCALDFDRSPMAGQDYAVL